MNESRNTKPVSDEELIGVLTAISVVSKRLAKKLIHSTSAPSKNSRWCCVSGATPSGR